MTSKNIVDLINRLASVKADASSVYTTAEVNSLTNANRELIEANTQTDITNYNSLDSRLNTLIDELANYLPLAGGNVTGNLTVQNKNVVRSVNGVEADAEGNVQTGFPSDTFVTIFENITNNATGSHESYTKSYTAPANGYVYCRGQKNSNAGESACYIYTNRLALHFSSGTSASLPTSLWVGGTVPVKKGDVINFLIFNLQNARATFIYSEGEI